MLSNPFDLPEPANNTNDTQDGVMNFGGSSSGDDLNKDPFIDQNNILNGATGQGQSNTLNASSNGLSGPDSAFNKSSTTAHAVNSQQTKVDYSPMQSLPADSAFQPQIDNLDFGFLSQSGNPTLVAKVPSVPESQGPVEDQNQAPPPDPFPFDLANYEIPEAEGDPEKGHDEIGGTGIGVAPTRPQGGLGITEESAGGPIQGVAPALSARLGTAGESVGQNHSGFSNKAIEELQLANVLQFMSNETKVIILCVFENKYSFQFQKILKSINATKGHAVHSYKTVRNKSEVNLFASI